MVDVVDLFAATDDIKAHINEHLIQVLTTLNRTERLDDFFQMIDMPNPFHKERLFQSNKKGKIVVLGQSSVAAYDLLTSAGKMGFDKSRFEFHLTYAEIKTLDIRKYQYQMSYIAVLAGPMPHSGKGKGNDTSMITAMENGEGYPIVKRLGENELKISKSSFQKALTELLECGSIEKDYE